MTRKPDAMDWVVGITQLGSLIALILVSLTALLCWAGVLHGNSCRILHLHHTRIINESLLLDRATAERLAYC